MEKERGDEVAGGGCCAGGPGQDGAQTEPSASCDCCGSTARRPWLRTAIAVVVILAAVAVGAYSLVRKPAAAPGNEAASCCPANSSGGCSTSASAGGAACRPDTAADSTGGSR
jgi:hypothetical protein